MNALEVMPDKSLIIAGGYQHIRMYDMVSNTPIMNLEGVSKNITRVGLQEDGRWMYTGRILFICNLFAIFKNATFLID